MKKGFLLLSSALLFAGLTSAQKLALFEEFSGENCGPCAAANPTLMTLLNANPTKVLLIKYQSPIPSGGPIYAQNTADVQSRMTYYSVPFAPYGRLNGAVVGAGANPGHVANATQAMIDAAAAETTPFTLAVGAPVITGSNFSVPVTITATSAASYTNLKLRFAMVEDLEFATPPGSNGETSFHHVMRDLYPDATGSTIQSAFTVGQTQTITVTGAIPSYVSGENPRMFIAWIQNDDDKKVLQAAKSSTLPTAVNALASEDANIANNIKCGASGSFIPTVTIKNTGTATLTSATVYYSVDGGAYTAHNWTGSIAPGATGIATLPAINVTTYGEHTFVDSLGKPNNVTDAFFDNNKSSTTFYLLNTTNEALPLSNDFEAANGMWVGLPGTGGVPMMRANVATFLTTQVAGTGYNGSTYAICFPFYAISAGNVGYYTLPQADMSAAQKALEFYVSYCQYGSENDKLEVVYSTDCGVTWTSVWSKSGSTLMTKAAQTGFFKPSDNAMWRKEEVNVSNVPAGARIAFKATSAYGNNLFIDNVKLRTGGLGVNDVVAENSIAVFPNPVQSELSVSFDLKKSTNVTVNVLNTLGQEMPIQYSGNLNAGKQTVKLDAATLAAGIYMLNIKTDEGTVTQKFIKK